MKFKKEFFICVLVTFLMILSLAFSSQSVYAIGVQPERITVTFYNEDVNSRGFNWVTNQAVSDGVLQIIKKTNQTTRNDVDWNQAESVTATYSDFYPGYRAWKAHQLNLEYNSTYYYRVGSPSSNAWSPTGEQYITDGSEGIRFTHLTDPQSYTASEYEKWTNTIDIITEQFPRTTAMLMSGDLTQQYTNAAQNILEWGHALNGPSQFFMDNVISPASGNHDKSTDMFYSHFNVELPNDQNTSKGVYFTYQIQDVQVIVLNTNDELTFSQPLAQKQLNWLEDVLSSSTALWKIVILHHAVVSTGRHMLESDINYLRADLMPLFSTYEVDLVIQGHDHVISRSLPYAWNSTGFLSSNQQPTITKNIDNHLYKFYDTPGTFYITQNMATARSAALSRTADIIDFPSFFSIAYSPINGKILNQQPNVPSFGYITIKDGELLYETYILDKFKDVVLYDYFGVTKNNNSVVERLIQQLPNAYHPSINRDLVNTINRFNQLSLDAQSEISETLVQKLNDLGRNISVNDYNAAQNVVQMIKHLGRVSHLQSFKQQLDIVVAAYENLTNIGKHYVENYVVMTQVNVKYQAMIEAAVIHEMITNLKIIASPTAADALLVRTAYDGISDLAKMYVNNYFELSAIEAALGVYRSQRGTS